MKISLKPIRNWRKKIWRYWSVRLNLVGSTLLSIFITWPDSALMLWNMMPEEVKYYLPEKAALILPIIFFALAVIARFIQQDEPDAKSE